jgi:energy-coupling factor transporter ATP-binding protein EcfA2
MVVHGAREHNLRNLTVSFPLGQFIAVTGVSGSGKSTLVNDILYAVLANQINGARLVPGRHTRITGLDGLRNHGVPERVPGADVSKFKLSPEETFLYGLTDGMTNADDVAAASGLKALDAAWAFFRLKEHGLIRFRADADALAAHRGSMGEVKAPEPPSAVPGSTQIGVVTLQRGGSPIPGLPPLPEGAAGPDGQRNGHEDDQAEPEHAGKLRGHPRERTAAREIECHHRRQADERGDVRDVRALESRKLVLWAEEQQDGEDEEAAPCPVPRLRSRQLDRQRCGRLRGSRDGPRRQYRQVRTVAERETFAYHRQTLRPRNAASSATTAA